MSSLVILPEYSLQWRSKILPKSAFFMRSICMDYSRLSRREIRYFSKDYRSFITMRTRFIFGLSSSPKNSFTHIETVFAMFSSRSACVEVNWVDENVIGVQLLETFLQMFPSRRIVAVSFVRFIVLFKQHIIVVCELPMKLSRMYSVNASFRKGTRPGFFLLLTFDRVRKHVVKFANMHSSLPSSGKVKK